MAGSAKLAQLRRRRNARSIEKSQWFRRLNRAAGYFAELSFLYNDLHGL
jgi:hypothetical protein